MQLVERHGDHGIVANSGVTLRIALVLTPDAQIGDYLLVHAGYSLSIIDECEAAATLRTLKDLGVTES